MPDRPDIMDLRSSLGPLRLGPDEIASLLAALRVHHPPALRINPLDRPVTPELTEGALPVPWYPAPALHSRPGSRPGGDPLFAAGAYYIQDAGSLLPVSLLDPSPGQIVCDLCASPGGKATAILEWLGAEGWLHVNEAVQSRLPPLLLNLARHGATRWTLSGLDPAELAECLGPIFDAVLVDAPCTAQSMLSRGRQTGRAFDPRLIEHSAARQRRILRAAVRLVRPGGRLVYSTCTFAWAENEAQVEALLQCHPMLRPDPLETLAPYAVPEPAPPACYRLWPHRHRCAGVFAARLQVTDTLAGAVLPRGFETAYPRGRRAWPKDRARRAGPPCPDFARLPAEWGRWSDQVHSYAAGDRVYAWPDEPPRAVADLAIAGPEVAHLRGRTWFPSYALAMRRDRRFVPRKTTELAPGDVRSFLAGQSVRGETIGWTVLTFRGLPLGWARGDGRFLANHLPKPARVTMR